VKGSEDVDEGLHEISKDTNLYIIIACVIVANIELGELGDGIIVDPIHERFHAFLSVPIRKFPIRLIDSDDSVVWCIGVDAAKAVEQS
jgi:hypothetical protein